MSMLQDIRQGRQFEVEAIIGNTVRLGKQYCVGMPRLETLYALLKGRSQAQLKEKARSSNQGIIRSGVIGGLEDVKGTS